MNVFLGRFLIDPISRGLQIDPPPSTDERPSALGGPALKNLSRYGEYIRAWKLSAANFLKPSFGSIFNTLDPCEVE